MNQIDQLRDGLRQQANNQLATLVLTREIGDAKLSLQVDPCSWMYRNYGLQASVTMAGGGKATIMNKAVIFENASEADLQKMLDGVKITSCKSCGKPAFDPESVSTNRDGVCETCFMAVLDADFKKEMAKEERKIARRDERCKKQGFTHRVDACIHPCRGDDYQISLYVKGEPSKDLIQSELKKSKSTKLDDYSVKLL